ncbi:MAG: radical SAM/SPASM domain-containing protein [Betaproteobacteria bacterium]|nr:radical SAM/SPASM domain-containing protein [Betaproteobacteria bacterium]
MDNESQEFQSMQQLCQIGDFSGLAKLAEKAVKKDSLNAAALRYLGIANLFNGGAGDRYLLRAAMLNDSDAAIWLGVLCEFGNHPKGSLLPSDMFLQVDLMKLRQSSHIEYPIEVHIETHAICNAKCSFCPYPTMARQGDRMPDELIDKIINDLKAIPKTHQFLVSPFKVNDPLLDKRIFSVCERLNTQLPNANLRLFTNGSPLTENVVEKIAGIRNLLHVWVSLNAAEKTEYETLMQLPFEKTLSRLDHLHRRVAAGYPHAVVLSRVMNGTSGDAHFMEFVAKRYPRFQCFMVGRSDWAGQVDIGTKKRVLPTGCSRWYEISIMASGKVALCCMDGEGRHVIGDVSRQSVLEIYNSPEYRKLRQFTFSRLAAATPCDTCVY